MASPPPPVIGADAPTGCTDRLIPVPQECRTDGAAIRFAVAEVEAGPRVTGLSAVTDLLAPLTDRPGSSAVHTLRVVVGVGARGTADAAGAAPPDTPEAYTLTIEAGPDGPVAALVGADDAGLRHAARTLVELVREHPGGGLEVPGVHIRDWPELGWRGTIEGFYGPPWTQRDRLEHLAFAARHKLNVYVYAPKDDPFHRDRWREPYPPGPLEEIRELAEAAAAVGVRFVYAISPGLTMRYGDPSDREVLAGRVQQLWDVGVRDFALLFDDIPTELSDPGDVAAFGSGPGAAGAAHGDVCAWFGREVLAPRGVTTPLLMCPTDYAGTGTSPYREHLARTLPADALVWWTGADIVVGSITRQDIDEAAASYGRRVLLWDNFPVNDFDRARLFAGPLTGRTVDVAGSGLAGITANPMIEQAPSQLSIATVADWAWSTRRYEPDAAARRALRSVAGPHAGVLAALVGASSSWPPDADQHGILSAALEGALDGDRDAATTARRVLEELVASAGAPVDEPTRLVRQLQPWRDAATAMSRAGLLALDLLTRDDAVATTAEGDGEPGRRDGARAGVRAALADAEGHYANVLRFVVPPFVREVLVRTAPPDERGVDHLPVALVVVGPTLTAGEHAVVDLLRARGAQPRLTTAPEAQDLADAAVVVLTRSASPEAAAAVRDVDVPLVAWAHLVAAGLAGRSGVLMVHDSVVVEDARHRLAAGMSGVVGVYRGPGKVTWGHPAPDAHVVARTTEGHHPALFHYPASAARPDGSPAPGPRTGLFLGMEALAPWLMTPAGRALVDAALDLAWHEAGIARQAVPAG